MFFLLKKKIKMHLYLNGVYVGKIRIRADEKPSENIYVVHFWFKKQIFKSNHVKCVIHPTKLLYTQNNITHWAFEYEKGIEV